MFGPARSGRQGRVGSGDAVIGLARFSIAGRVMFGLVRRGAVLLCNA
jgi:hypothetical protein